MSRAMCIRRDGEAATGTLCRPHKMAGQVQALRTGVDFESDVPLGCFGRNTLEVERVALALHQNPPGSMPEHFERGGFECSKKAVGHLSRLQIKVAVHASDHEVQLPQSAFRQV